MVTVEILLCILNKNMGIIMNLHVILVHKTTNFFLYCLNLVNMHPK